jgi:zinc protease
MQIFCRWIAAGLAGSWLLVGLAYAGVEAQATTVHEHQLSNGMRVLVKEDNRAPVVVSQVWYRVGSSYEPAGLTGISHVLEHMMFKGTEKYGPNEFSKIIAQLGGRENAFTGRDYTAYFQRLEASRLEKALELEADRMRNLVLDEAEFLKEREVVAEERRMRTDDKPTSLTYERFLATAYVTSGYHHPVIGWMDDIQHWTIDDLRDWYQRFYAPNNAILVVVGDVKATDVVALAEKYFGALQPSDIQHPRDRAELPMLGERRIHVQLPAKLPYFMMGYAVPSLMNIEDPKEAYALEVLASVLDGGDSARLPRELMRGSEVAASAGAGYDLSSRLRTLFLFDGVPSNGKSVTDLQNAIEVQIARVQNELVAPEELERIKAQVMAAKVFERDSMFYQAMQIGMLETIGLGWPRMDEYLDGVRAVTAEEVRAVAQKYLQPSKRTIAVLDPLPLDEETEKRQARASMEGGHRDH